MENYNYEKLLLERKRVEYLEFLASSGILLPNFKHILELNASVEEAIATNTEAYNQFLLSDKVKYTDLYLSGLLGGRGYITDEEVVIPKSLEADAYFLDYAKPHVPYKVDWYMYPRYLEEYDLVFSHNLSDKDALCEAVKRENIKNFIIGSTVNLKEGNAFKTISESVDAISKEGIQFEMKYETKDDTGFYLVKPRTLKLK